MLKHFIVRWYHQWKELLADTKFKASLFAAAGILLIAYYVNYRAALYTNSIPVLSVGDLILDNIPTIDLSFMFTFGIYAVALVVVLYPLIFKPEILPFTAKTVAAFILIRAFFISLTHLGAPANFFQLPQLDDQPGMFKLFYMNDLFFSGHTGFPFLAALLFWENKILRFSMIAMSVAQSFTVLFMHVHYSIDVFSAFFITYSIFAVSDKIFNNLNLSFKRIVDNIEKKLGIKPRSVQ
ncbi:MAG: phosphatase PAP2-related protein [Candidatus Gracilibacteria bacterium]